MKKSLYLLVILMIGFALTGCDNKNYAKEFKNDYESVNGTKNASGKEHRTVNIDENNKFVETTPEKIVEMIDNKETFYVYFGSRLCPCCRSTIEMADQISRKNGIEKVYYVDIWDDEGKEILRDKYTLNNNNEPELTQEGASSYKKLLEAFSEYLSDYNLTTSDGETVSTGEKRIYAPNYFFVQNGECKRMTSGTSSLQEDSRGELTEDILNEEKEMFNKLFLNYCDDLC